MVVWVVGVATLSVTPRQVRGDAWQTCTCFTVADPPPAYRLQACACGMAVLGKPCIRVGA